MQLASHNPPSEHLADVPELAAMFRECTSESADLSEQREYSMLGERKTFLRPGISPLLCGLMVTTVDDVVSAIGAHRLQAI